MLLEEHFTTLRLYHSLSDPELHSLHVSSFKHRPSSETLLRPQISATCTVSMLQFVDLALYVRCMSPTRLCSLGHYKLESLTLLQL